MKSTDNNLNAHEALNQALEKKDFSNKYQEKWESRSSIRTRPRKKIDFKFEGFSFPVEKQPLLLNQEILNLGLEIKKTILLHSFYKYLNDIIHLEIKLINSVCYKLMYKDLKVKYSEEIKLNSHTIIIDEFYHVYIAKDMLLQLKQHFCKIKDLNYPISDSYHAIIVIKNKLAEEYHDLFEIIAVCIFETTLVRELVEFFNSKNVHPSIKYYVNDHMNDEARHYGFFYDLLTYTWERLPEDYKENIGKHLGEFIKLYLNINSDKAFNLDLLISILNQREKSIIIIENLYKGFEITPDVPIVKNVLGVFEKSGILKNNYVKEGFRTIGWNF